MFFTIISRIPALASEDTNKFLKIFIIGAVLYLLCHYYLFSMEATGLLVNVKKYYYYLMGADFVIAYLATTFLTSKKDEDKEKEKENDNEDKKYSKDERDEIDRAMKAQAYRQQLYLAQQQAVAKQLAQQANENKKSDKETHSAKSTKSSTKKEDNDSSDKKSEKVKHKKNKKSNKHEEQETKTKTETDIPTFNADEE